MGGERLAGRLLAAALRARRSDPGERGILADTGFDDREADFIEQGRGGPGGYRVWFGIVETKGAGTAVRVADRIGGARARVIGGRHWAFTTRDPDGQAATIDPVAYDASGAVVADESAAPGGDCQHSDRDERAGSPTRT